MVGHLVEEEGRVDALADQTPVEIGQGRDDRVDPALRDVARELVPGETSEAARCGAQSSSSTSRKSESWGGASSGLMGTGYSSEKQASQVPCLSDCATVRRASRER